MKSTNTMAEAMSARFGDDGGQWTDADGVRLEDALRAECEMDTTLAGGGAIRATFADGSAITLSGDSWDLGYADCYCWRGAGHTDECAARQ